MLTDDPTDDVQPARVTDLGRTGDKHKVMAAGGTARGARRAPITPS